MNENTNNRFEAYMEVSSMKIDGQDKKIAALVEQVKNIPDNRELIEQLVSSIDGLRKDVTNSRFPEEKMQAFSRSLDKSLMLLSQPPDSKVLHHHHIPKITWIAAGLFVAFALVCSGWYSTGRTLDQYIANDTKYRSLRLDTGLKYLQSMLDNTDQQYEADSGMRKLVLQTEEKNRKNFELLLKAERLKYEAKDLEKEAKGK